MSRTPAVAACAANARAPALESLCAGQQGEERSLDVGIGAPLRVRQLPFGSSLVVEQKGGTLWPSGQVLAYFVSTQLSQTLRATPSLSIVELGSGVAALPGLTAARLGAKVTVTDFPEVALMAKQNATANGLDVEAVPLMWGEAQAAKSLAATSSGSSAGAGFEVALLADVLYDPGYHVDLALTLDCVVAQGGKAYVAVQDRSCGGEALRNWTGPFAFFHRNLPRMRWASRQLDITQTFDAMKSNSQFRATFSIWECWRGDTSPAKCAGMLAGQPASAGGGAGLRSPAPWVDDEDSDDPVVAPREQVAGEDSGEDSDPPMAPPE